jgi:hypothetical protein
MVGTKDGGDDFALKGGEVIRVHGRRLQPSADAWRSRMSPARGARNGD